MRQTKTTQIQPEIKKEKEIKSNCSMKISSMASLPHWEEGEEKANSISHSIGIFLSIIALFFTIHKDHQNHDIYLLTGMLIFIASMFILYTTSTLYHGITNPSQKVILRFADHCCVYVLIAGSYAPYCLTILKDKHGYLILTIVWITGFLGSISKIFFFDIMDKYTVISYLLMGWFGSVMFKDIILHLPHYGVYMFFMSAFFYSCGTFFYSRDEFIPFFHAVFHVFILLGSICYFFASSSLTEIH
jgi:hemolysin III